MTQNKTATVLGLQKELKEFKVEMNDKVELILTAVTKGKAPDPVVPEAEPTEVIPVLSQQITLVFNKYFDEADGFKARENYPERNRVTIDIPKKFSNASSAHWDYYKNDERSSRIITENYEEEVEKFFKAVAKQLHYNKQLKTK